MVLRVQISKERVNDAQDRLEPFVPDVARCYSLDVADWASEQARSNRLST